MSGSESKCNFWAVCKQQQKCFGNKLQKKLVWERIVYSIAWIPRKRENIVFENFWYRWALEQLGEQPNWGPSQSGGKHLHETCSKCKELVNVSFFDKGERGSIFNDVIY